MTIQDVAEREKTSERQAQRYVTQGFRGTKLHAVKVAKAWSISDEAYRDWRIACGWETAQPIEVAAQPQVISQVAVSPAETAEDEIAPDPSPYPAYPLPADPHGVLTNTPHEHSCNHPHPLAVAEHMRSEAEKLVARFRGTPNATPKD